MEIKDKLVTLEVLKKVLKEVAVGGDSAESITAITAQDIDNLLNEEN